MYSFLSSVFNYHGRPYGKHELILDKTCGKTYWGISVKVFLTLKIRTQDRDQFHWLASLYYYVKTQYLELLQPSCDYERQA